MLATCENSAASLKTPMPACAGVEGRRRTEGRRKTEKKSSSLCQNRCLTMSCHYPSVQTTGVTTVMLYMLCSWLYKLKIKVIGYKR